MNAAAPHRRCRSNHQFYSHRAKVEPEHYSNHLSALKSPPPMAQQPLVGQGLLIIEVSRSHSNTSHSVGLLWTSDQPDAETSTWQHTTLTADIHAPPPRHAIWTRNPSNRVAADPRLRSRGHWDRLRYMYAYKIQSRSLLSELPNTVRITECR
jgi:hypothetical protein